MGKLFGGKDWDFVFVYLHDILVVSQSMEEHLSHLEKVATIIQEAGLRRCACLLQRGLNTWVIP